MNRYPIPMNVTIGGTMNRYPMSVTISDATATKATPYDRWEIAYYPMGKDSLWGSEEEVILFMKKAQGMS